MLDATNGVDDTHEENGINTPNENVIKSDGNDGNDVESTTEYRQEEEEAGMEDVGDSFSQPSETIPALFASDYKPKGYDSLVQSASAMQYMEQIAEVMIKSQLCPFKRTSDVILAIMTGNQYGFQPLTSVSNIYPINGRPTMSVHLHIALLLKHKIFFNKELDFEPIYNFAKKIDGVVTTVHTGILKEKPEGTVASLKPIDYVTRYRFKRQLKQPDGTFETIEVKSEFKMSDAHTAGLLDKDVWKKWPQRMLTARAFTAGAKEIAADIMLGIYTVSELADEYNVNYTVTDNLEEVILNK